MATSEKGCCVPGCGKTREDGTVLHSFPNPDKDVDRYLAWTQAIGIEATTSDPYYVYKNRRVCHDHFETKYLTWTRRLSPGALPTLLLPGSSRARAPLVEVNNHNQNVLINTSLPSTSKDAALAHVVAMPLAQTLSSKQKVKPKTVNENTNLIKMINKLQNKKANYATRLKKALNLSENKTFQNALNKFTTLAAMFTLMQFRETGKSKMGRRFLNSEKIMALSLYKRSPRAYRWLQRIFVLPSSMTLSRMIAQTNLKPGINENLFNQLKKRVEKMTPDAKLCILLFDEMSIAPHFKYNSRRDEICGFANNGKSKINKIADHALVFMIRGVQKNYKQAVAYTFCSGSTSATDLSMLIIEIIRKLNNVGLNVVATICDQGTANVSAVNNLIHLTKEKYLRRNVELRKDVFEVDDKEVVPLYDTPHLIKGIRNNLINKNLTCCINGTIKTAKWEHIIKLHQEDPAYKGIRLIKKLTDQHIKPDRFQKMKVKYATQVLSQRVAVTMGFLAEQKILPAECTQTADVILFFDELFDSLNGSYDNSKKRSGKDLLLPVTPTSKHHNVWSNAKAVLKSMKFLNTDKMNNRQVTPPSVKNWLQTINNVEYLIKKIFENYNIKSVWMRHFNQDPLENFFGAIRSHGCRNTNPTVDGFESSFSAILINNLSGQYSPGSNCEEDSCKTVFKAMKSLFKTCESEPIHTDFIEIDDTVFTNFDQKKDNPRILATLQYVTGFILRKAKTKIFKNCKTCNQTLYDKNNCCRYLILREYKKGHKYLTYPSINLINLFSKMQDIITYLLKKQPLNSNIKTYFKTHLYTELEFDFIDCEIHKTQLIDYLLELSCNFFLYNWCRDLNKILNGTRLEINDNDETKISAFNYYQKKKHNKKQYNR